jgi:hypothetical protein
MKYNENFLDINYSLIRVFLLDVKPNIIEISYSVIPNIITVQIVLLENTILEESSKINVTQELADYAVEFNLIHISRETYNLNKGSWQPIAYNWLANVILSKSEI